jgi:hypothetical protein
MHAHPFHASCVQIFLALFPKLERAVLTVLRAAESNRSKLPRTCESPNS